MPQDWKALSPDAKARIILERPGFSYRELCRIAPDIDNALLFLRVYDRLREFEVRFGLWDDRCFTTSLSDIYRLKAEALFHDQEMAR